MENLNGLSMSGARASPDKAIALLDAVKANSPPGADRHAFARVFRHAFQERKEHDSQALPVRRAGHENTDSTSNVPGFLVHGEGSRSVLRKYSERFSGKEAAAFPELVTQIPQQRYSLSERIYESSGFFARFDTPDSMERVTQGLIERVVERMSADNGKFSTALPWAESLPFEDIFVPQDVRGNKFGVEPKPNNLETAFVFQKGEGLTEHWAQRAVQLGEITQQTLLQLELAKTATESVASGGQTVAFQPANDLIPVPAIPDATNGQNDSASAMLSAGSKAFLENGLWRWSNPDKPADSPNSSLPDALFAGVLERVSLDQPPEITFATRAGQAGEQVFDQVVQGVRLACRAETGELQVSLKPEFLGRMMIRVISVEEHIRIEIRVENEIVRQVMQDNLADLQQRLAEKGLAFTQLSLLAEDMGYAAHGEPEWVTTPPLTTLGHGPETEQPEDISVPALQTNLIDYFV